MKYKKEYKSIRDKYWTKANSPHWSKTQEAMVWCNDQPSNGRYNGDHKMWFFQKESDALWFSLQGF